VKFSCANFDSAAFHGRDQLGRAILYDFDGSLDGFRANVELLCGFFDRATKGNLVAN
jgi:hypothetical protein